jgi:putative tryptophan/tyrosine transport system substrate-binding protein
MVSKKAGVKPMTKKILVWSLAIFFLTTVSPAEAQQPKKIARIGYLFGSTPAATAHNIEAFRQGMWELGHVEGKTFVLELRYGEARAERFWEIPRELVGLKLDMIVAATDVAIAAVKRETQTIPIVMATSNDPVATGLVASLARPGGNVTGLSIISPELSGKRLELLREVVPGLSRVAFLWNPDVRGAVLDYRETEGAAGSLRLQLQSVEVVRAEDLDRAFSVVTKERAQALIVPPLNPVAFGNRDQIASFVQKNKLPSIYAQREYVDAGGLMSYGPQHSRHAPPRRYICGQDSERNEAG